MLLSCATDIEGPRPSLADPSPTAVDPVEPGVVCRDQVTTTVAITGEGFSPLPYDLAHTPRIWLPTVTLTRVAGLDGGPGDGVIVTWDGRPEEGNTNLEELAWQSETAMTLTVRPEMTRADATEGPLPTGVFDLTLTNANGHAATSRSALALVPEPTLASATPNLVCLAQGARTVALEGTSLLRLDGREPTLRVGDVAAPFALATFGGCVDIPHPGVTADLCTSAEANFATDSVPVGLHALTLLNPETAPCTSLDDVSLRVVPPPSITRVEPPAECTAESTQDVVIVGADFLEVDTTLPTVTLDGTTIPSVAVDECEDLPTQNRVVRSCKRLTVTLPVEATESPRRPTLTVTNPEPAGCSATTSTALVLVPPPVVSDIAPPVICDDGTDQILTLAGSWFFEVGGEIPAVMVDSTSLDSTKIEPLDCQDIGVPDLAVSACETLDITVNPADVEGPDATFAVMNPTPVECADVYPITIPLVAPPAIEAADPDLICTDDGPREVTLRGDHFLRLGDEVPAVTLGGTPVTVLAMDDCTSAGISTVPDAERCTSMTVRVAEDTLEPGPVSVSVTSPLPIGCAAIATVITVPPRMRLDVVAPDSVCVASGETPILIRGDGFTVVGGRVPTVTLGGEAFVLSEPPSGCTPIPGTEAESCTALSLRLPEGAFAEGDIPVTVTNPATDGCTETATGIFYSVPVPDLTAVSPLAFCADEGGVLTLTGRRFSRAADVSLAANGETIAGRVTWVSETELSVAFDDGIPPGLYDVTVSNAQGCADTLPLAVEVHPNPLVFFIDPPVVYNGITIEATIYLSGLDAPAADVALLGPNGETLAIPHTSQPDRPNRITVRLEAGLAPGPWGLRVTSAIGCIGDLEGAFEVTDRLAFEINAVDPAYVWQGSSTAITITSDEGGFVRTPRAYLNPKDAPAGTPATNVRAVLFDSETTLTGVVPAGLAPDQAYELIVVNPDATVGIYDAMVVTANPPPVVTAVLPGSINALADQRATLVGEHFTTTGMSASMICRGPTGLETAPLKVTPVAGTLTPTSFDALFPGDLGGAGSACVVTVVTADGSSFRYSAISIKTPAQNLNDFVDAGAELTTPRRALGLVAGRPTAQSRFLYAIGGDAGSHVSAYASTESARVGLFGDMGQFTIQHNPLPEPRTFVGAARIGRYLYAVGGDSSAGAVRTVYRALILDPLATPEVLDLGVDLLPEDDPRPGLEPGLWIYRVAALFPEDDTIDPLGESLPGEPLVVQLPDVPGLGLTLTWDTIPGASGYRVYRTPLADLGVDDVQLIATTVGTALVDGGDLFPSDETPLGAGSHGRWVEAGSLVNARAAAAIATAPHPTAATTTYLYAFGGRGSTGAPTSTWERTAVNVTAPTSPKDRERQSLLSFTAGTPNLTVARAEAGAFVVRDTDVEAGIADGRSWIFIGPGRNTTGAVGVMEAGLVLADGGLGNAAGTPALVVPNKVPNAAAGYGFGYANGFLNIFGGANGDASAGGSSAELCLGLGLGGCSPDTLPNLRNWTGGIALGVSRVWMGSTQESAFFFVAGGFDGAAVRRTVLATVQ
jgi:hypothetical protein